MSNSSKSEEHLGIEDLLSLENPTPDVIFCLNTDHITKIKQTIIAIPYINFVLNEHYQEVLSANDFQSMCLQLNLLKKRIIANTYLESKIKKKLFLTFVHHINQFFDNYGDASQLHNVSQLQPLPLPVQTEFPLIQPPQEGILLNQPMASLPVINSQYPMVNYPMTVVDYNQYPLVKSESQLNDYLSLNQSKVNFIETDYSQLTSMPAQITPLIHPTDTSLTKLRTNLIQELQNASSQILGAIAQKYKPGEDDVVIDIDTLTIDDINNILIQIQQQ
ncbi:hypothetical protein ENUP19_0055G0044 [Entamoeba nuttalli]|uniref:NET domain-containing protein n=2 Tax=Entamoeba nuttalli TaxID=412467 RepID=K2GJD4_ENTNP|nr:hypothetical protein ENU1_006550 [Entamoeba nuttalli P19]EKE42886.1 hypothetical protein ENU1_006550 [Entamoeba nuttalli P19]|eukprot:XP_008854778.1 hypothetical protein ENU1_006550 [Entamoeba nuttalli P19]